MAIQAQWYPNNSGFSVGGDALSRFNQQKEEDAEQRLRQLLSNESQRPVVDPNLAAAYGSKSLNFSPTFAFQLEKQREEVDHYLRFQNEKLRMMVQEQGKQQVSALLRKLESRSHEMLKQKDDEIAQAEKRRAELEELIRKLEAENRGWQRMAQEKEAMALTLYRTLEEMQEKGCGAVVANDAESCCDKAEEEEEKNFEEQEMMMMICKSCNSRKSCYLFLPCRHISCCKVCDEFLEACPVCTMPKKASIELRL